jgi:hypothetical protein
MYRQFLVVTFVSLLGCGGVEGTDPDAINVDPDAAPPVTCTGPFATLAPVPGLASATDAEYGPRYSPDELTAYLGYGPQGGNARISIARRASVDDAFTTPQPIAALASELPQLSPTVTADQLTLVYTLWGDEEALWMTTRASTDDEFGAPVHLDAFDGLGNARQASLTRDGSELWFTTDDGIYRATRAGDTYQDPVLTIPRGGGGELVYATPSADALTIYVTEILAASLVWRAERATTADPLGQRELVTMPGVVDGYVIASWLSDDGCRLYGYQSANGSGDAVVATRAAD